MAGYIFLIHYSLTASTADWPLFFMLFSEYNLHPDLLHGLSDAGYVKCTPVQAETLKHSLEGKDVLVQSQTGTGKTAAFLVSLYQLMLTEEARERDQALVIAPTRELASQIEAEAQLLGVHLDMRIGAFYGGTGYDKQERMLESGVDIIIGTPGRLIDFSQKGRIDMAAVGYLVIDEADRLFDMGFYPDLKRMLRRMRAPEHRQTMLFSATLAFKAQLIASQHMNEPESVTIAPEQVTVKNVDQELYHVANREKTNLLLGLLKQENPGNCLLFVNRKYTAEQLAQRLEINGYPCECLTGDLPQTKREQRIKQFKDGDLRFMVATDVASRGLHVNDLDLVVNYDLPQDTESYVHRIGRTARAGKSGKAITLACEDYVESLGSIEKYIGMKIPVAFAGDELYHEDRSAGMDLRRRKSGESRHSSGSKKRSGSRRGRGPNRTSAGKQRRDGSRHPDSNRSHGENSATEHAPRNSNARQQQKQASSPEAQHQPPHKHRKSHSRARKRQEQPISETTTQRKSEKTNQHVRPPEGKPTLLARIAGLFKRR
ncbi:MAG: DEAD/DEAH box helicase [Chitinivibrionales bacterium]|nr:DEAD/DEAH box helicase [Chitinivibrionales bacterium]MBD3358622.1 DEAD/DEAH box helicase [Chitinivibrionales bacterium]